MPHLMLDVSENIANQIDLAQLCTDLHAVMADCEIFPLGGIRVRAHVADAAVIADTHPENGYAAMVLRIGAGRTEAEKTAAGLRLLAAAEAFFAALLARPHFALSLEIQEIGALRWNVNSIHARVQQASAAKPALA